MILFSFFPQWLEFLYSLVKILKSHNLRKIFFEYKCNHVKFEFLIIFLDFLHVLLFFLAEPQGIKIIEDIYLKHLSANKSKKNDI